MGALTIGGANDYFTPENHPAGQWWQDLDQDEREAGLAQAQRVLERSLTRTLVAPTSTSNYGVRDDYALYEQAAWVIHTNHLRGNAEYTSIGFDLFGADGRPASESNSVISAEAQRWLAWNRLKAVRG
ncbi:MAG: hypothetical protein ACTSX8_01650 [Alphaproteobacteria bacterium]